MNGCLRTRVRKQPNIALYFESENELKFYNLEARDSAVVKHKINLARVEASYHHREITKSINIQWRNKEKVSQRTDCHS